MVQLRVLTKEDYDVMESVTRSIIWEYEEKYKLSEAGIDKLERIHLSRDTYKYRQFYGLIVNGEIAGITAVSLMGEEIVHMLVVPKFRAKGFGTCMLRAIINIFKDVECSGVYINVHKDDVHYFTKNGFVRVGENPECSFFSERMYYSFT